MQDLKWTYSGTSRTFPSKVPKSLSKVPSWFHSEFLRSPRTVRFEARLLERIFGKDGDLIPHVECVSHTLLHVNRWNPDGEAEILVFGRPYFQQDVAAMIKKVADHFRQLSLQSADDASAKEAEAQQLPVADARAKSQ
ncbi:KH domain-containing protein 3-like [Thomomys bottae]